MVAQIEQRPREGVELAEPWTWRDSLAVVAHYVLMGLLFVALWFPHKYVLGFLLCVATGLLLMAAALTAADGLMQRDASTPDHPDVTDPRDPDIPSAQSEATEATEATYPEF